MMRIEHRHPAYYLECDRCGMQSLAAPSKESALRLARENGWRIEETWNGLAYVTHHLCPWCQQDETKSK